MQIEIQGVRVGIDALDFFRSQEPEQMADAASDTTSTIQSNASERS